MYKEILQEAKNIQEDIVKNRRAIHKFAEIGFELPNTVNYVLKELKSYGIEPKVIADAGITFTIGKGEKTFLIRGDMDALPTPEDTGLDFSATNGNCHACGHDIHTAMMLGAAKILKNHESQLKGVVKFMFQPAEEQLAGAKAMVEENILENPKVDAAFAIHITTGLENSKSGVIYHAPKELNYTADAINITVKGKDAHGSTPNLGVDSIYVASHIAIALKSLTETSVPPNVPSVVLVGKIAGGTACNTVPGETFMEVTVRSKSTEYRNILVEKIEKVSKGIAESLGAEAIVEYQYGMPLMYNDDKLDKELSEYIKELLGTENVADLKSFNGSEDFALIGEKVPSTLMLLGLGSIDEGYPYYLHHPSLKVDETAIYKGSAIYAYTSIRWLEDNSTI